ncbi:hypothetical protein BDZ97DRAFT_1792077 [Flammula alnicola]|nr:hypothetical protein BDZ97DRAFT_1792077 [Flammula alnicola]
MVTSVSVFDTVVLSLGALTTRRLEAAMPAKRLAGGLATVFCFAAAASFNFSVVVSLPLPAGTAAFALLLPTNPVTSTNTSLFLFTPVSFSSFPLSTVLAFEAAVDAVARVVAEVAAVPPPNTDFAREVTILDGRALAFSLSLVERATLVVLLTGMEDIFLRLGESVIVGEC